MSRTNKKDMIDILRGNTIYTGKQVNDVQRDLNEIADYIEDSVRVVRCKDCKYATSRCDFCNKPKNDTFVLDDAGMGG